ncbi:3D domain-containing protein [Priestia megaterium]|uniref:3D domain-containing protein n=1 Tax=Priestia megaterium TaxID=1404 RepID=UPI002E22D4ED|nr:3D domain-containing protein [Priestia megaterium]MED4284535.1 3D domain-containing protein [Priestia megaterium]MED4293244.1 3D domain-containing protein [Priestia megaterium]
MKKTMITFSLVLMSLFGVVSGASAATNTYTVKSGDSLYKIAKTYKVSVSQLKQWNNLKSDSIHPKQVLKVSQTKSSTPAKAAPAKSSNVVKEFKVTATAYTANCKGCSGKTAIGIDLKKNPNQKVISVDPNVIKLGSKVYVEGYGTAIAADTGGAIKGNKIDVLLPSQKEALKWGRKTVKVQILK